MERLEQLRNDLARLDEHCDHVLDLMAAIERELVRMEEGEQA